MVLSLIEVKPFVFPVFQFQLSHLFAALFAYQ